MNEKIAALEPTLSLYHDLTVALVQIEPDSEIIKLMIKREEIR